MTLNLTLKWLVLLAVGLVTTQASAEQTLILKTQKDKQSYATGVELFRNFKNQGADLDLDLVMKGLKDAQAGDKLKKTLNIPKHLRSRNNAKKSRKSGDCRAG